jgi:uncharacterized membrane protein
MPMMKKKLLKTILYRFTASSLAQLVSWIFFRKIEVNAVVLSVDLIQMVYYFFFESIWTMNRSQLNAMKKRVISTYNWMNQTNLLKHKNFELEEGLAS